MHKRFERKLISCLLAFTVAAAIPGELMLTESVYGAEESAYYDEVPADEIPADEIPADGVPADEASADEAPSDEGTDAAGDLSENDLYGSRASSGEEEEAPLELSTLFYEDYEHASGGVVPVIWNTSDSVSQRN